MLFITLYKARVTITSSGCILGEVLALDIIKEITSKYSGLFWYGLIGVKTVKKTLDFFKNLSVKWKFVSTYFMILLLQIILAGFYLYVQASNSTIDEAKLVMEQNLMQTKASILQKEKLVENISSIIRYDKNMQNFLELKYKNGLFQIEDYQFNFTPILQNFVMQNNIINSIKIYMSNAVFTEMQNGFYGASLQISPELYKKILDVKPLKDGWITTHKAFNYSYNPGEEVFSLSSEIMSPSSLKNIGVVEIEIKENMLFDMLADPVISKLGKVFIVDNKETIVSDNIPKLFNKNITNSGIMDCIKDKKISRIETVNSVKSIVIAIPVEEIGCSVVGIFPVSNYNSKVKASIAKIIVVLLIASLLSGIIIYLITNLLLDRVKILVKAMKQVKAGNIDVSVEVKSKDEFGELGLNFNHMTSRMHDLVEIVYKIQIMEKEAQLKALESQINPHFLYNTLATISWVARKEKPKEVVKITNSLAKFYRLVLSNGQTLISVKEEVDIVVSYLYIQKIRFQDTLDIIYDLDESIYDYKIIKNILQPIVENALIHGIADKRGNSTIIIKTKQYENQLYFKITDDGIGMSKHKLEEVLSGTIKTTTVGGYAIKNIMERLRVYYGEEYSFKIFSRPGIGTVVTIGVGKHLDDKFRGEYTYLKR